MQLIEFSYKVQDWEVKNLEFGDVSLIVGKNSTGKSKTLNAISLLGNLITQRVPLFEEGSWNVTFLDHLKRYVKYSFTLEKAGYEAIVVFEELTIEGEVYLKRNTVDEASISNVKDNEKEGIFPPVNKLVIHTNRDVKKYPFLEEIALWAENSFGIKFGSVTPEYSSNIQDYKLLTAVEELPFMYKSLNKNEQLKIKEYFNGIGYNIEYISFNEGSPLDYLSIKEKEVEESVNHYDLSQGMYRSLLLLVFLEFLITKKKPSTVIVDDLCEGLDYERATKLGKLVYEMCQKNNIQLIATSNDMFLMDVVDLEYWNVLQRRNGVVTALNAKNNSELFENFKFTGLSNFDFFASDYIAQKIGR